VNDVVGRVGLDPKTFGRFCTRCPRAQERCALEEPPLRMLRPDHFTACHFPVEAEAPVP
jgi:peptide/nickel transport system ATP-binding protein